MAIVGCVQWTVFENQLSTNSLRQLQDNTTLSACQNFCVQTSSCVAVDFVSSPGQCWVHTNVDNLLPNNTRTVVSGVAQYRLNRNCSPHASTASTPTLTEGACTTHRLNVEH